jgi:hypothetical protein
LQFSSGSGERMPLPRPRRTGTTGTTCRCQRRWACQQRRERHRCTSCKPQRSGRADTRLLDLVRCSSPRCRCRRVGRKPSNGSRYCGARNNRRSGVHARSWDPRPLIRRKRWNRAGEVDLRKLSSAFEPGRFAAQPRCFKNGSRAKRNARRGCGNWQSEPERDTSIDALEPTRSPHSAPETIERERKIGLFGFFLDNVFAGCI